MAQRRRFFTLKLVLVQQNLIIHNFRNFIIAENKYLSMKVDSTQAATIFRIQSYISR